ncbi:MAG TPA: hypothetical protein PLK78_16260 [Verrucomicrobiota bacterium]|nr:hypothetical protein [Verrucomicrobiota bacterium]
MKRTLILALIGAMGMLAGTTAFAQPGPRRERPQRPPQEQQGQRPPRPDPEVRKQRLLEQYDANKNGVLDESEYAAIGRDVEAGRLGSRLGAGGPALRGPGGPGVERGPGAPPRRGLQRQRAEIRDGTRSGELERPAFRGGRGLRRGPGGPPPPPANE